MTHHPIEPRVAHVMACEPLGDELVSKVLAMDGEWGGTGIPLDQLKLQIRCAAAAKMGHSSTKVGWRSRMAGTVQLVQAEQVEPRIRDRQRPAEFSPNPRVVLDLWQARPFVAFLRTKANQRVCLVWIHWPSDSNVCATQGCSSQDGSAAPEVTRSGGGWRTMEAQEGGGDVKQRPFSRGLCGHLSRNLLAKCIECVARR